MQTAIKVGLYLIVNLIYSQNLVLNPSFEDHNNCPWRIGKFNNNVFYWSSPNLGSTDYFNDCSKQVGSTNYNGFQNPKTGNGFAGFYLFAIDDYREYAQGQLKEPLVEGKQYEVSFFISLAEESSHAMRSIEILFTKERLGFQRKEASVLVNPNYNYTQLSKLSEKHINPKELKIDPFELVNIEKDSFLTNKIEWTKITCLYTAKGFENYLAIGNFHSNNETENQQIKADFQHPFAYYYLDDVTVEVIESEFKMETVYIFQNVLFDFDKAILLDHSVAELDRLFSYLNTHPEVHVEIYGHTDSIGSHERNEELSKERAKAVSEYLILQGLEPKKISWIGFGSSKPITENTSEFGRSQNRRVEFKLIKK